MLAIIFVLMIGVFVAPAGAVDHQGSFVFYETLVPEEQFNSKKECEETGKSIVAKLQEGMRIPLLIRCVEFPKETMKNF